MKWDVLLCFKHLKQTDLKTITDLESDSEGLRNEYVLTDPSTQISAAYATIIIVSHRYQGTVIVPGETLFPFPCPPAPCGPYLLFRLIVISSPFLLFPLWHMTQHLLGWFPNFMAPEDFLLLH